MPYLSDLMDRQVADPNGDIVGKLEDIIAATKDANDQPLPHPLVTALAVRDRRRRTLFIPFSNVMSLLTPVIVLNTPANEIAAYTPGEHNIYLVQEVLDKQIIDVNGTRVVRVNDIELIRINGQFYVGCVDIGELGLLRRLGLAPIVEKIIGRLGRKVHPGTISWDNVELLPGNQPMRLRIPREKLSQLHPADIAEIMSELGLAESGALLRALDVETAADTLEEVEPEYQATLLSTLDKEHAADVLEAMSPDEAADLLHELPAEDSRELLELMEDEEAEDVRKLLTYPEDSAGGIMTTEYVAIAPNLTAAQAITAIRECAAREEAETFFYIYVTDPENHLLGVFSLQDLVLAQPDTPVAEFMHHRVVTTNLHASQEQVAQLIAKYNLLAVPVVDDKGIMHGIITADDALDKIIPTAWKKRLPRLYH